MRYQNKQPKRQFISGAVCQSCGAQDTTALHITYDDSGKENEHIACAVCEFTEHRPSAEELYAMQAEKDAKITAEKEQQANVVQVVTFKPNPKKK